MANIKHATLSGSELHEPKGIEAAAVDAAYISNGSSTGAWKKVSVVEDATEAGMVYQTTGVGTGSWVLLHKHGMAKIMANATLTVIAAASTWTKVSTGWSVVHSDGISFVTDEFIVTHPGDYLIRCNVSFIGGVNDVWAFDIAKNGTPVGQQARAKTSTNTDVVNLSIFAHVPTLVAGDKLSLYVKNETNGDDILVSDAVIMAESFGVN